MTQSEILPAIVLSRRPRRPGEDRSRARSWLGGAPRLGGQAWPRGGDGRPLHFMAQLDLAEIAATGGFAELPAEGALAFFIGNSFPHPGKVIFVPAGAGQSETEVPADMPDVEDVGGDVHRRGDHLGRPLFPFWPVDFTVVPLPAGADPEGLAAAQQAAIGARLRQRQSNLSARAVFEGPPVPRWWQHAIHYASFLADSLRSAPGVIEGERRMIAYSEGRLAEAQGKGRAEIATAEKSVAMYRRRLAEVERLLPAFEQFVAEVGRWVGGRRPWAVMSDAEWGELATRWSGRLGFPDFTGFRGEPGIHVLRDTMFAALPAIDSEAFATLPEEVRALIRARRAPRPMWWYAAIEFAGHLREAESGRAPALAGELQGKLDAARTKLRQLRPSGVLARLWTRLTDAPKDTSALEAEVATLEERLAAHASRVAAFSAFVAELSAWVAGRDPWSFMTAADIARLAAAYRRAKDRKEFDPLAGWRLPHSLEQMEAVVLRTLAAADDAAYATLPDAARRAIEQCLVPIDYCHQMLGVPADIQGNSEIEEPDNRLLLQLGFDDMMFWDFGDNGVYQFWIRRQDLAARNWDAVKLTFECH